MDCCFLPDVIFIASEESGRSGEVEILCQHVRVLAAQMIDILLAVNRDVDFTSTNEVSDFLFRGGRIAPQPDAKEAQVRVLEKRAIAERLHVHLLTLPPWWKCECLFSEEDRINKLLRTYLKHFCKEYCELERRISLMEAGR